MPWKIDPLRWNYHKRRFDILLNYYGFVADVSHWWLPYFDLIKESYEDVRVVALKRDQRATVQSFLKIKTIDDGRMINHWIDHDGSFWIKNAWDSSYPKYNVQSIEEALKLYWERYYKTVDALIARYPSSVRIFPTEGLSNPAVQLDILSFCGFDNPKTIEELHLNKEYILDGMSNYMGSYQ